MLFNKISNIIQNKELFSIDHIPDKIICRQDEIKELAFHLSYIFRNPPSLPQQIIFGTTGTGKTTTILYILNELEKEIKEKRIKLKIVKIKASEAKTKFEIMKRILIQIAPESEISNVGSDIYNKIVKTISEKGYHVLIFIDELHDLREQELNGVLYTISRLGQDISFFNTNKKEQIIENLEKGRVGYILVSNDANIRSRLRESTKSSLTRESIIFKRYSNEQLTEILKNRIEEGALYPDKIEDGCLNLISAFSLKEGQDARYSLILLCNAAKEAEKRNMDKITLKLVEEVHQTLSQDYLKQLLRDLPPLYVDILHIIYFLHTTNQLINSKTIWTVYQKNNFQEITFSRISQIITCLEKENIIYVSQSKKTKLRNLSIEENLKEIEEFLMERLRI